ncbi:MAG TPA: helicase HerA-like domain-containing protein [Vicinamibacteria bacterium]|nr:helicase HerA-like domain-containing protein [Vicinamibacteria bacterium]
MAKGLYLGKVFDPAGGLGTRLDLDADDLLTHGFIVGMTGSGKTGLAIVMIEELVRQGVPVLAIDPKGDLGNLLLTFGRLDAASFEPWLDSDAVRREGQSAAQIAEAWRNGLAEWGLDGKDVASLEGAREATIYTPGSTAGVPLDVLQSLEAPAAPFESAQEDLRDEITGIVAGILGLLGIEADPLQSREFILLSTLIETAWREGRGLTLESLLAGVADPPFERLGALAVESVFPRRERQGLLLALNNLLAAPSFEAWRRGEPLDVDRMLRTGDGRARLSIVYTAHLQEAERLFVTALVLDKVKTWMRRQPGTSALRALVYMDEIFGYFPPHPANPPTKRPLLTLLKQARAQGVGVVLATQNPVDLDYKGLANAGTWLVGTLQTQQDRARLREGLLGTGLAEAALDALLDGTRKRVFLLHDVHRAGPTLVHVRWAMSYLRGPLTREEVGRLMAGRAAAAPRAAEPAGAAPVLPSPLTHNYASKYGGALADPHVFVKYAVRYKGAGEVVASKAWPLSGATPADSLEAEAIEVAEAELAKAPSGAIRHGDLPEWLGRDGARLLEKALRDRLPDKLATTVQYDPITKETSAPGEPAEVFAARLGASGGGAPAAKLRERLARKRRELELQKDDVSARSKEKWLAVGSAILSNIGLLTGRKRTISGAGAVLSKNRLENAAEGRLDALSQEIASLEQELGALETVDAARFEARPLVPGKGDVKLLRYDLLWVS